MSFENERQLNIKCLNKKCTHQGNDKFIAHCDVKLKNGDPGYSICKYYIPEIIKDIYKEKLVAFCKGLEVENIDNLLKEPSDRFKMLGEKIAESIKNKNN